MAFDEEQLAQFSSVNSYGLYRYDTTDPLTLVDDVGYMNNIDDDLNLAVGDMIEVFVWVTAVRSGTMSVVARFVVTVVNDATGAVTLVNVATALSGVGVFRGALVNDSSEFTMTTGVQADLDFNNEEYDTDNIHDTSVNPSRLTVPAGVTRVQLWCQIAGTGDETFGDFIIQLIKNGSGLPKGGFHINLEQTTSLFKMTTISTVLEVNPTDFFELRVFQNSGGDMTVDPQFAMIIWQ